MKSGFHLVFKLFFNQFSNEILFSNEEINEFWEVYILEILVIFEKRLNFLSVNIFIDRMISNQGLQSWEITNEHGSGFDFTDLINDGRDDINQVGFTEFFLLIFQFHFSNQRNNLDDIAFDILQVRNQEFFFIIR